MKDIKLILKQVLDIQALASVRAKELLMAKGCGYDVYVDGVDIDESDLTVKFIEKTNHDCPDKDWVMITVEQLEMEDAQWNAYIETVKTETLVKAQKEQEEREKKNMESKKILFDQLKQEFGG